MERGPGQPGDSDRSDEQRVQDLGAKAADIVREAGALLDEELAAGIVAAQNMRKRFEHERRLDPADFDSALRRFQSDGHALVNAVGDQLDGAARDENAAIGRRLVENMHGLLDLAAGMVSLGSEVANQLLERTDRPRGDASGGRSGS